MTAVMTDATLYSRVQHFYAKQMQALDGLDFETYARSFTPNGSFAHSPGVVPAVTRAGIVAELEHFHERFADDPVQRRHWFNHIALRTREDGAVDATVYALVVTTRPNATPVIAPSCVVHDVLEIDADTLTDTDSDGVLVRSRLVTHDQMQ